MQLQHELHHELLAHILELLFRSLHVGFFQLACLGFASKHVALPVYSDNCECLRTYPGRDWRNRPTTRLRSGRVFEYPTSLPKTDS